MEIELLSPMVEQTGSRGRDIDGLNRDDRKQLSIENFYTVHFCWRLGLENRGRGLSITEHLQIE
jgi:hypothetical protein